MKGAQRRLRRQRLWVMQEGQCARCRTSVDPSGHYNDDDQCRGTLEHRIPLSVGGTNAMYNTSLVHYRCNRTLEKEYWSRHPWILGGRRKTTARRHMVRWLVSVIATHLNKEQG